MNRRTFLTSLAALPIISLIASKIVAKPAPIYKSGLLPYQKEIIFGRKKTGKTWTVLNEAVRQCYDMPGTHVVHAVANDAEHARVCNMLTDHVLPGWRKTVGLGHTNFFTCAESAYLFITPKGGGGSRISIMWPKRVAKAVWHIDWTDIECGPSGICAKNKAPS